MDFPISTALSSLLLNAGGGDLQHQLSLATLALGIADRVTEGKSHAKAVLHSVSGSETADALLLKIGQLLPVDSTVRDLGTTGHLAKILSRRETFEKLQDWRVVGLPHVVFDPLSWRERNEFFSEGVCHAIDSELFDIPEVVRMLAIESAALAGEPIGT